MGLSCVENPIAGAAPRRRCGGFTKAASGSKRRAGDTASGRLASVSMVQTSQRRQRDDVAPFRWLSGARMEAVLVQCPMCAVAVEIVKIIPQDPAQVVSVGALREAVRNRG